MYYSTIFPLLIDRQYFIANLTFQEVVQNLHLGKSFERSWPSICQFKYSQSVTSKETKREDGGAEKDIDYIDK